MKIFAALFVWISVTYAAHDGFVVDWTTVSARHIILPSSIILWGNQFDNEFERIVGGEEASRYSIPYQVGILIVTSRGNFFCGGALISSLYVLTAAHCLDGAQTVQVRLGAHRIRDNEPAQLRINASRWRQHESWNSFFLINDIAVIELSEEVMANANIQFVSLPRRSQATNRLVGRLARISGWGMDADTADSISPVLRQVNVNVIGNFICNIPYLGAIRSSHICTSGRGGRGSCSGDSGGPLVINNTQVGIVSFGVGFGCEVGWPSVFTRVTSFLDWIESNSDVTIRR